MRPASISSSSSTPLNQYGKAPDQAAIDRRGFLKTSFWGGVTLSAAGVTASLTGCGGKAVSVAEGYRYLRPDDLPLFRAIIPAVLSPIASQPGFDATVDRVLQRVDMFGFNLDAPARAQIYQLFDLLNMRATRWLTTGIASTWQDASAEEVAAFLTKWQTSSIGLFNVGYRALSKFVGVGYFSLAESRAYSAYSGPQAWALQATRQATSQATSQPTGGASRGGQ